MGDNDNISKNAINGCRTVVLLVGLDWVSLGGVRYRVVAQLDDLCKDHWLFVLIISLSILSTERRGTAMYKVQISLYIEDIFDSKIVPKHADVNVSPKIFNMIFQK